MKNLKEFLKGHAKIWIDVNKEDFSQFLQYAKDNDCTWSNGKVIDPKNDNCNYYMSINSELQLSFIPAFCWYIKADNSPVKFKFKELLGE